MDGSKGRRKIKVTCHIYKGATCDKNGKRVIMNIIKNVEENQEE